MPMDSNVNALDRFQIVGFVISAVVALGLIAVGQNTVESASLGLLLSVLVQLFDLQLRHSSSEQRLHAQLSDLQLQQGASERRLLEAGRLEQALYRDEFLLHHVKDIVDDYLSLKDGWFDLFKRNADKVLVECCRNLHIMADQAYTFADFQSPLSFGLMAFQQARKSIKIVVVVHAGYWRQSYSEQYLNANAEAIRNGVEVTRMFLQPRDVLKDMLDVLKKQQELGVEVRVGYLDSSVIPPELVKDCLIMDDRAVTQLEIERDGKPGLEQISIDPTVVQRRVQAFDMLMHYTKHLNDALEDLS
jgi:hypothetical protein